MIYQIDKLYGEIENCLRNRFYMAALMLALSLPDICSKVETNHIHSAKEISYVTWFNKWYDKRYFPDLSHYNDRNSSWGKIVYDLRCSIMHNNDIDLFVRNNRVYDLKQFNFFVEDDKDIPTAMSVESFHDTINPYNPKFEIKININLKHFIHGIENAVRNFMLSDKYSSKEFPTIEIKKI